MHVVDDLRMPDILQFRREARFGLRENVPVAIVVVADVLVIELRRRRAFIRRAQRLAIPARHDIHSVGILRRHQHDDHVVENGAELRRILREQVVDELNGGVRGGDFGGVNGAGDQHHRLAFA